VGIEEVDAAGPVRDALLAAGLVLVAGGPVSEDVVSPSVAWRLVASGGVTPSATVPYAADDAAKGVNAAWRELADRANLPGAAQEFYLTFQLPDSPATGWLRVRGGSRVDLTPLGPRPGRPEVVALSLDGEQLLAATCEEYEVWLVAFARPAELPLARRAAADRSTPDETQRYFEGLRRLRSLGQVRVAQLHGLAANPAAPDDVLMRVLTFPADLRLWDFLRSRALSDELLTATLAHPDHRVRCRVVENSLLTSAQRLVLLTDRDERVRHLGTVVAVDLGSTVPEEILLSLSQEPNPRIRQEAARLPNTSARIAGLRARDASALVRRLATERDWPRLTAERKAALLDDSDPMVRGAARLAALDGAAVGVELFATLSDALQRQAGIGRELADDLMAALSAAGTPQQRAWVAANPHTPLDRLLELARDDDADVRLAVSIRPGLTEDQRAAIAVAIDPDEHYPPLDWVRALHGDPKALAALAESTHVLIRRNVAMAAQLPAHTAELLARDEDFVVRLLLAEHCRQAPADLLLRTWHEWTGFSRADLVKHPNFPRRGLARHLDDPESFSGSEDRYLALQDPEVGVDRAVALSNDPDPWIRRCSLANPTLPASRIAELADDSDPTVRITAAAHPGLPLDVLRALLDRADTATAAASNPALPHHVMRDLIRCAAEG
jgi:hypothetical protein